MPGDLTTAAGVIAALTVVIGILWRDHLRADADDRKDGDEWKALAQASQLEVARLAAIIERDLNIRIPPKP